jgi:hypothetical protein
MKKLSIILAAFALFGCGGKSSDPTGPTETASTPAVPVTATPPPRRFEMVAESRTGSPYSTPVGDNGCVIIHADDADSACGKRVELAGAEGTRGTVEAVPESGFHFVRWSPYSSDCAGESVNPCSFAFDRAKHMTAEFGKD